jgi:hypothetical protein
MRSWSSFMKVSSTLAVAALFVVGGFAGTNAGPLGQATATEGATVGATIDATVGATMEATVTLSATLGGTEAATGTGGGADTGGAAATETVAVTATTRPAGTATTAAEQSATAKCVPVEVTVFTKSPRLHVKCEAPTDGILYFATGTEKADNAQRILTVLITALTNGKALSIVYDPVDTSGQAIGCLSQDCRLIISASILR